MKRILWIVGSAFGLFVILCCCGPLGHGLVLLVAGWAIYPAVAFPQMSVETAALSVGFLCFVLLIPLAHGIAAWLYGHAHREQNPPPVWRLRWTSAIVGVTVLLFAAGICIIVVVHQLAWLVTTNKRIYTDVGPSILKSDSKNRLHQIGRAAWKYGESQHHYPPGGSFDQFGSPLHSWETMLLPYSEYWEYSEDKSLARPDLMSLPWNDPRNAEHFKVPLREYLNPGVDGPRSDSQGYGLSHYAANARVLGPGPPMRKEEITDGLQNTIMAGEVKENFRPWGDPLNFRDPAEGVQKSPDGFAGPWSDGSTQFLMMDGSVRQVSKDIDPAILKALATPNGGEKVPDNFEQ